MVVFLSVNIQIQAQIGFQPIQGAVFNSLGRAGVTFEGIEAIYSNQACLSSIKGLAADITFERRFNLKELDIISLSVAKKFNNYGIFGISISQFGFSKYNEQKIGLAYGKLLSKNISIGGQFDYLKLNIEGYETQSFITFEIGTKVQLSNQFSIGAHVFNPINQKINEYDDLYTRFRIGLQYSPSNKVLLMADADKTTYKNVLFKIGVAYRILQPIQIYLGSDITNQIFGFGFKYSFQSTYHIAGGFSTNNSLGQTSAISLQYLNKE
ncbi:MAG: hypothetical protein R2774_14410 [Saprospiraceae bacterium]